MLFDIYANKYMLINIYGNIYANNTVARNTYLRMARTQILSFPKGLFFFYHIHYPYKGS